MNAATAPSRAARALALTSASALCALAAAALAITVMGKVHRPGVILDIALPIFHPKPAVHKPVLTAPAAPPARIDKVEYAGHALIADPALVENSLQGPIPRIADDGRKPMLAYAAPAAAGKFRIAIVISGLGMSDKATQAAIAGLPAAVTLAFEPYSGGVQQYVSEAREKGHEALLEVPMEPMDFPDSDPGPNTLRSGVEQDGNGQRLNWAMSRFTGYAGVTNLLGQRFLSDSDALSPTMVQLARRGLYFFDNGAVPQSVAPDVAGRSGTAFAKASETLDDVQNALEIDRHLSALEDEARAHGTAIGSGFLYPVTVSRVAAWAKGLEGRGFVLVPVSAIVNQPPK
ncbi:MAG TPA: divergent polysaccharide deacetylase family protein [Rhizomicrobium sp.]|nr:divergent polysaccharide deacetylase family protein [Rhizomicrobium sp.]